MLTNHKLFTKLRRQYAALVTSGAQLILLAIAAQMDDPLAWIWCLALMALISLFAWFSALTRLRTITGTPTSKIASAAQGYVELIGQGNYFDGTPIISNLMQLPCLWYRYRVERKNGKNEWRTESSGESSAPFLLEDGSASCVVDPSTAEIITNNHDTWTQGEYRYNEWRLLKIDSIYAIGEFKTVGGSTTTITHKELVNQVLTEWKMDNDDLLKRFDLNQNGLLDMDEWMLARQAAKREASKRLEVARAEADANFLMRPHDGRLFLISNLSPDKLARKYYWWAWIHLVIFWGALGGVIAIAK
ncbi:MAG: hypothetical protein Q8O24_01695 [Gallionellaceae bacterium]|nr:hypothetical protein [Gallionellaceae bacterium]